MNLVDELELTPSGVFVAVVTVSTASALIRPPSRERSAVRAPVIVLVPLATGTASAQVVTTPTLTRPEPTLTPAARLSSWAGNVKPSTPDAAVRSERIVVPSAWTWVPPA